MRAVFFLKQSTVVRGNAHVERYIEHALLRANGVALTAFDLVKEAGHVAPARAAGATDAEVLARYRAHIIQRIRDIRPDLFLVINGYALEQQFPEFFAEVRALGPPMAAWHADDPYYVDIQEPIVRSMDYVFTVDRSTVEFWQARVRHASYLPFAFAPESTENLWSGHHRDTYASDVCFIGAPFAGSTRVATIDANAAFLAGLRTRIMGATSADRWERHLQNVAVLGPAVSDRFVEPVEALRYITTARINLNIHKESSGHAWDRNRRGITAQSPNERVFAIGGTGAFQLIDDSRPDLVRLFPPEAVATFSPGRAGSFEARVREFLEHAQERTAIAGRLRDIVLAEHTYDHRIATLLSRL